MINTKQLKRYIIKPTLKNMGCNSQSAVTLLILTASNESKLGKYIKQLENGPACGIYQMEINTAKDIYGNYLKFRTILYNKVEYFRAKDITIKSNLIGNLYYSTAMARTHYLRIPESLPKFDDIEQLALYYKKYYNTNKGDAVVSNVVDNYKRMVF